MTTIENGAQTIENEEEEEEGEEAGVHLPKEKIKRENIYASFKNQL